MHLYVAVKGTLTSIKQWEDDLQAVRLPFEYEPGKQGLWRMAVRPCRLYELGFPADQLDTVMSVIGVAKEGNYVLDRYPVLKKARNMIRKFLKLKKVPEPKHIIPHMQPNQVDKAVAVVPIGIKEDEIFPKREQL